MKENTWKKYSIEEHQKLITLSEEYKEFLSLCKTERECCKKIIQEVEKEGFKDLNEYINEGKKLKHGDKIYVNNRGKAIALFIIGSESITKGINILGSHIDSPRLDLKANPLYEDSELAYFDTHYYGGIKKYQWVTLPLSIHGIIVKKGGTKVNIEIGEEPNDPVVGVTDLLIHLSQEQLKKEASNVIEGEKLDVLIGSMPIILEKDSEEEAVKKSILRILNEKYQIEEDDFASAEIEIVPAGKARDFGLDRSMVISYGQDDRSCTYASLKAFLSAKVNKKTLSCIFVDKEEIGSVGATGMYSSFYENAILEISKLLKEDEKNILSKTFSNSKMLSSDVNAAYDPLYKSVMEKRNSSYFNRGVVFCKYTGSKGKSGSNDANAEYLAELRKIMDEANVSYQFSELGKVDAGGGGTIAYILANKNVEVVDCGIGVLNMHAPWEITSKSDLYEAYCCYIAFLEKA